jgi:drug/metabolite transporter (DMT)-like permease
MNKTTEINNVIINNNNNNEEDRLKKQEYRDLYIAILYILLASLLFTIMSVCIVEASNSFPSFQLFFARQFSGLVYTFIYLKYYNIPIFGPEGIRGLQILNGLTLAGATFCYMYSVAFIPLADASALTYTGL